MEPRPLLEENATEIEKALLRAGRADGPPKEAGARVLAALQGLPPVSGPPALPSTAFKPAAHARLAKIVLLAVGVGGAALVANHLARTHAVVAPSPQERVLVSEGLPAAAPREALAPGKPLASPETGEASGIPREEVRLVPNEARVRRASPSPRAHEASANPLDRSLAEETRALDRAREVLDAHRPSETLRLLDEYHRRFPQARLRPEAMVLRLAALVQTGKHSAAEALAGQLLADEAYRTYAPRIRSLLREGKQ